MGWVRIDDSFADHEKIIAAGEAAVCLYVCGLTYCAHMLTDGAIPKRKALVLYPMENAQAKADRLVEVGLWHDCGDYYEVHDYLDYQPSREQVENDRKATAVRVGKFRASKAGSSAEQARNGVSNGHVTPLQERYSGVSNGVGNGVSNAAPIPIPIPIPEESKSKDVAPEGASKPAPTRRAKFVPPTESEAIEYGLSIGLDVNTCKRFVATGIRDGWTTGAKSKPMANWKGAMQVWKTYADKAALEGKGNAESQNRSLFDDILAVTTKGAATNAQR